MKNSRRLEVQRNTGRTPGLADILTIAFELDGQTSTAPNGGLLFKSAKRFPLSSVGTHKARRTIIGRNEKKGLTMSTAAQQVVTSPVKAAKGDFVWHELRTTDAKGAQDFYTHVVGWQTKPSGDPGGMPYTLLTVGDLGTAGLMQLTPDMLAYGMRAAWVGFIGVDDVDDYAKRVEQAGGKLHCEPMDIPTVGRFVSAQDPQGAVFLMFKGAVDYAPPRPPMGTPGMVGWNELSANDGETAWSFYSTLFGWKEEGPWTWARWVLIDFLITAALRLAR